MSVLQKTLKGAKVAHFKNTENCESTPMPLPKEVCISMSQHMGPPCNPLVKKAGRRQGRDDDRGQRRFFERADPFERLGDGQGGRGDRHGHRRPVPRSSSSRPMGSRRSSEHIKPPEIEQPPGIRQGDPGLRAGGARRRGLPDAHQDEPQKPLGGGYAGGQRRRVRALHHLRLPHNHGTCRRTSSTASRLIKKYVGITQVKIAVENNKPQAIEMLRRLTAGRPGDRGVQACAAIYPKGAEKVIDL